MSKVIEFQYRDGGNYKRNFNFKISDKKLQELKKRYGKLKAGVEMFYDSDFNSSQEDFHEELGYEFDEEVDHNIIELQKFLTEKEASENPVSFYIDCDENN